MQAGRGQGDDILNENQSVMVSFSKPSRDLWRWGLAAGLALLAILAASFALAQSAANACATEAAATNAANQAAMGTSVAATLNAAFLTIAAEAAATTTAAAKTATAEALAGDVAAQATGSRAAELAGTAEQAVAQTQAAQAATQVETAAAQTQTAEAARFQNATELSLALGVPKLQPEPGSIWVTSDAQPSGAIRWPVTNTSPSCAWNSIKLIRVVDKTATALDVNVLVNGQLVVPSAEPIAPGTTMIIVLPYAIVENVKDEWFVQINGQVRTSWRVAVNVKGWVFSLTLSPAPTPMPTPRPQRYLADDL